MNQERWTERIVEIKPTGLNTGEIVWEWNLWDHLVQNLYPTKNNYQPTIIDHPGLLNINYNNSGNNRDFIHMNGIDYNAELDQIVVSSRYMYEIWVIDHSTTTAEAASHSGGNSGKGGDFIYRWGNPAAYGAPGNAVFNVVHDAHWVPKGSPREGWLGVFNNFGVSNNISAVDLFQPPWDGVQYTHTPGQAYLPLTYGYRHATNGFSGNMSSSQQLPNGNMLVCLAAAGKVYEIDPNGNQLWQYTTNFSWIPKAWRYSRCFIEHPKIAVASPDPSICSGGGTQLSITPTATNVSGFSYEWWPAEGLSDVTAQNPIVSGLTDTTFYTVKMTTSNGCTATASIPVNVLPLPAANAGVDVTILSGQSAPLTATGGDSYLWSTGETSAGIMVS
ncbi:MAG: aryl-sulfate sulfotransferase, partial [Saprospiraceae bacterium]|nr:aryl-sulfate sulfotransferase [Saprospiraceae bacterium]